ncbi:DEAD/DEAH box helicase family protein, partial [Candidatus Pacearchaeota archaeon]|nr:DEAD/DEAH box helicase family protein [Candidatus Pacearchaeota archaeon]
IEAKKTSEDPEKGKRQALNYAEKIAETQNIPIPLVFYTNGYDIYFWDSQRYPPRKVFGFPTIADIERILFLRDNVKPLSSNLINPSISGRPYQIQAIRSVLEKMEQQRRQFLLVMATGTGKTRTCMGLLDVLMRANWTQKVLFLVDRVALAQQAIEAIQEHLPNAPYWPKQGEKTFKADRRIYVTTYPTMLNLIQQDVCPLNPHYFDMIVADESHRSVYNVYKNIFDYFDAVQLGLTATPKDHIDHNTFEMFDCENEMPTFAYSYQEALDNVPPYLCDFEALSIKTKFQAEGINSETISENDMIKIIRDGEDPDLYNFEGTDLEKKVSNRGTNTVIVREFMEESIKDPSGVLPGKTIFFAISKKHAYRLCEVMNNLYPEYKGRLAEVILSDVKGVHGKGGLLDQFKNQDMPRIAISVDMLDTGIDIREPVNLVFAKPVFSYTKFWQMIGRGTRILEPEKIKPWCPEKDKFLIMDCWQNFEYFKMRPKGKEPTATAPLPVRLFWARIEKLNIARTQKNEDIQTKIINCLRKDII